MQLAKHMKKVVPAAIAAVLAMSSIVGQTAFAGEVTTDGNNITVISEEETTTGETGASAAEVETTAAEERATVTTGGEENDTGAEQTEDPHEKIKVQIGDLRKGIDVDAYLCSPLIKDDEALFSQIDAFLDTEDAGSYVGDPDPVFAITLSGIDEELTGSVSKTGSSLEPYKVTLKDFEIDEAEELEENLDEDDDNDVEIVLVHQMGQEEVERRILAEQKAFEASVKEKEVKDYTKEEEALSKIAFSIKDKDTLEELGISKAKITFKDPGDSKKEITRTIYFEELPYEVVADEEAETTDIAFEAKSLSEFFFIKKALEKQTEEPETVTEPAGEPGPGSGITVVEPGEDQSAADITKQDLGKLKEKYASLIGLLDFSSCRLIVGIDDGEELFANDTHVVSSYNSTWLLQYDTPAETAENYLYLLEYADFVEVDTGMEIAAEAAEEIVVTDTVMTEGENPFVELEAALEEKTNTKEHYDIALIDTGADEADAKVSMIGDDVSDENGHGNQMLKFIKEQNPDAKVLSIKALGKDGKGDVSAVYAAIQYAINMNVDIINLSISAYASADSTVIEETIKTATEKGITVVGAAGNNGKDAKYFVPGKIDHAVIVGACDENGERITTSNFGKTVDYNLVAVSTSEAAARFSGWISVHSWNELHANLNDGFIYEPEYIAEQAQEEPDQPGRGETSHDPADIVVLIKYLFADTTKIEETDDFASLWAEKPDAAMFQIQKYVTAYKDGDQYVFSANMPYENHTVTENPLCYTFAKGNDLGMVIKKGVYFDHQTREARVDKSVLEEITGEESVFADIQLQLLIPMSYEATTHLNVDVENHNNEVEIKPQGAVTIDPVFQPEIKLVTDDTAHKINGTYLTIYRDEEEIPLEYGSDFEYDYDTGIVKLSDMGLLYHNLKITINEDGNKDFTVTGYSGGTGAILADSNLKSVSKLKTIAYVDFDISGYSAGSKIADISVMIYNTFMAQDDTKSPLWSYKKVKGPVTSGQTETFQANALGVCLPTKVDGKDFIFYKDAKFSKKITGVNIPNGYNPYIPAYCHHTNIPNGTYSQTKEFNKVDAVMRLIKKKTDSDGNIDAIVAVETKSFQSMLDQSLAPGWGQTTGIVVNMVFKKKVDTGFISLNKTQTLGYDTTGAVYTVYADENKNTKVGWFVVNNAGTGYVANQVPSGSVSGVTGTNKTTTHAPDESNGLFYKPVTLKYKKGADRLYKYTDSKTGELANKKITADKEWNWGRSDKEKKNWYMRTGSTRLELPVGTYYIQESSLLPLSNKYTKDDTLYKAEVKKDKTTLITSNEEIRYQTLTVSKKVTIGTGKVEISVTGSGTNVPIKLTFKNSTGANIDTSFSYSGSKSGSVNNSSAAITLNGGEKITVSGLPAGTKVTATNQSSNITKEVQVQQKTASEDTFTFTVTIKDEKGAAVSGMSFPVTGKGGFANVTKKTNKNGRFTLTLKDAQSAVVTNIPKDYQYTVVETNPGSDYTTDPSNRTQTGELTENKKAAFTNTFDPAMELLSFPSQDSGSISITKQVSARDGQLRIEKKTAGTGAVAGDKFKFHVVLTNKDAGNTAAAGSFPYTVYKTSDNSSVRTGTVTSASNTIELEGGQYAVVTGCSNLRYTVTEDANPNYTADPDSREMSGEFSDPDLDQVFNFQVNIKNEAGVNAANLQVAVSRLGIVSTNASGNLTVGLQKDETVKLDGLPVGYSVAVTETVPAGYTQQSRTPEGAQIIEKDKTKAFTFTNKQNGETETVTFTNTSGGLQLKNEKAPANGTLSFSKLTYGSGVYDDDEFEFTVSLTNASDTGLTGAFPYKVLSVRNDGHAHNFSHFTERAEVTENVSCPICGATANLSYEACENECEGIWMAKCSICGQTWYVDEEDEIIENPLTVACVVRSGSIRNGNKIKLKGGETLVIEDMPPGSKYRIVETAHPNYATYEDTVYGQFDSVEPDTFTVTITDQSFNPVSGLILRDGSNSATTYKTDEDGQLKFTLAGGESVTLLGLPMNYHYEITDTDGNTESDITTAETSVYAYTDDYVPDDHDTSIVNTSGMFEVEKLPLTIMPGTIKVSKTVTGTAKSSTKAFTYTATALSGTGMTYKKYDKNGNQVASGAGSGNGTAISQGGTFTLTDGQYVIISNVKEGSSYKITETADAAYTASPQAITGTIPTVVAEGSGSVPFEFLIKLEDADGNVVKNLNIRDKNGNTIYKTDNNGYMKKVSENTNLVLYPGSSQVFYGIPTGYVVGITEKSSNSDYALKGITSTYEIVPDDIIEEDAIDAGNE